MGDERLSTLVISEAHRSQIGACLDRLIAASEATCAMLLDVSGMLLNWRGDVPAAKMEGLGVLLANGFVAARQVARILGESRFDASLQQGRSQNILSEAVGDQWILVTIFHDRTAEGIVRLLSGRASSELTETFASVRAESAALAAAPDAPGPSLGSGITAALDNLFRDRE